MSYTDLRDFVPEFTYESPEGLTVEVEKAGGGTLGTAYDGQWRYIVTRDSVEISRGQDYWTGMFCTHEWVAKDIAAYFSTNPDTSF